MRRVGLAMVIVCVFSVLGCDFAWAQATAQISGTVRDESGAVLPGADRLTSNCLGSMVCSGQGR